MWPMPIIIATTGGLLAAIFFHRAMEARRMKRYIRDARKNDQPVYVRPRIKPNAIVVMIPDGFEVDFYAKVRESAVAYVEQLGNEIAQIEYRRGDDDEAQVVS